MIIISPILLIFLILILAFIYHISNSILLCSVVGIIYIVVTILSIKYFMRKSKKNISTKNRKWLPVLIIKEEKMIRKAVSIITTVALIVFIFFCKGDNNVLRVILSCLCLISTYINLKQHTHLPSYKAILFSIIIIFGFWVCILFISNIGNISSMISNFIIKEIFG